jgi:hypothetical protein
MKNTFLNAINSAVHDAINSAVGMFQELTLGEGETRKRFRLAPYGEHPVVQPDGSVQIQVVDREAARLMHESLNSLRGKLATFFKGVPIYEGHADSQEWCQANPGHKATAIGRIKSIEAGDDGIYVDGVFNAAGAALIGGEAPAYSGHSPHWRMAPIAGTDNHYRPWLLWSTALTNRPNIPDNTLALNSLGIGEMPAIPETPSPTERPEPQNNNTDDTMKLTPDALKALGFAADAEPSAEEVSAAIIKMLSAKTTQEAPTAPEPNPDAVNEAKFFRDQAVNAAVDAAVADGRITEADKPKWKDALNTSFVTENEKLSKLMPTVNTKNHVDGLNTRKGEGPDSIAAGTDAINTAVQAYAREHGHDLNSRPGYDAAWEGVRKAKPELFPNR